MIHQNFRPELEQSLEMKMANEIFRGAGRKEKMSLLQLRADGTSCKLLSACGKWDSDAFVPADTLQVENVSRAPAWRSGTTLSGFFRVVSALANIVVWAHTDC